MVSVRYTYSQVNLSPSDPEHIIIVDNGINLFNDIFPWKYRVKQSHPRLDLWDPSKQEKHPKTTAIARVNRGNLISGLFETLDVWMLCKFGCLGSPSSLDFKHYVSPCLFYHFHDPSSRSMSKTTWTHNTDSPFTTTIVSFLSLVHK